MKLHQTRASGQNQCTGYGTGYVSINGERHEHSLILLADRLVPWPVAGFDSLDVASFEMLAGLPVEVLLLGTGLRLRFPAPTLTRALRETGIGLEVMDTQAACRTYNILLAEHRRVGAALLIERG